jgi:ribosomal protein S27AE
MDDFTKVLAAEGMSGILDKYEPVADVVDRLIAENRRLKALLDEHGIKWKEPTLILCPECGELAGWNSHFQKYFCSKCGWYSDIKDGE